MNALPKGWTSVSLAEVGFWRGGGTPSKSNASYWVGGDIPWVSPKDMKRDQIDHAADTITLDAVSGSATQLIPKGSILLVVRSGILRHSLPVAVNTVNVTVNQDLKALTPHDGIEPDFIALQLRARAQTILAACAKSGTTVDSIDFEKLKAFAFNLAPLPEQRRIVTKLDALAARTASARAELDRVPSLAARYRKAILGAAFKGDLTADYRGASAAPQSATSALPHGWAWGSIGEFSQVTGGLTKNPSRAELSRRVPYLRVANVYADDLRLDEIEVIGCTDAELEKTVLRPGDLLVVEGNGSLGQVGRVSEWRGEIEGCSHQNHLIRIRLDQAIVPTFALYWLLSPLGRHAIEDVASSTSGLQTLSISKVKALPLPYCEVGEQREVIQRIKTALTEIDRLTAEAAAARRLLDRLDQAVLAKAFRGKLVPQDPADEPASALLARIRAQRAGGANTRRGRRRSLA